MTTKDFHSDNVIDLNKRRQQRNKSQNDLDHFNTSYEEVNNQYISSDLLHKPIEEMDTHEATALIKHYEEFIFAERKTYLKSFRRLHSIFKEELFTKMNRKYNIKMRRMMMFMISIIFGQFALFSVLGYYFLNILR